MRQFNTTCSKYNTCSIHNTGELENIIVGETERDLII